MSVMNASNKSKRRVDWVSLLLRALVYAAAAATTLSALGMIGFILVKGVPHITAPLFAWRYTSDNVSLTPALINTALMTALALAIAAPLGILSAVYLAEYARRGNRLVKVIRMASETLAGVPSIVFGLFGFLFFVIALKWGLSMLAGGFTLAIMILPLIMRTAEEAMLAVPDLYREGSFGLGAGRLRTVFRIVLPAASPGILAGIILSIGRVIGESAALILTAGTAAKSSASLMKSGRTMAVHMYALSNEGLHIDETYATAVVLIVLVALINALSSWAAKRAEAAMTGGADE
ncbi:MAG: phosphate ABC transporter permease PstA [Oscillospiraceae bacterium]|jgi:phosphate transport system permease protein|nr:phosphate ABC transporter permease PstA [Oscillospiraceae bacterium]